MSLDGKSSCRYTPPTPQAEVAHAYIFALNRIREDVVKTRGYAILNIEIWEMMLRTWGPRWDSAGTESDDEMTRTFEAIRADVHAIVNAAALDGKSRELYQIPNLLCLQGQKQVWKPILCLALFLPWQETYDL